MAQFNDDDGTDFQSEEHKAQWIAQKKAEYKDDANDWRNIPLFSSTLDPNNPQAAAIIALQKTEKPRNRAKQFKNSGNKAYQLGPERYQDAITYYTQALEVHCKDKTLNSTIYANRAQINLCLHNYGKVVADCKQSVALQPNTYKSYWRAAMALKALSKHKEAIEWCDNGLSVMEILIEHEKQNPTENKPKQKRADGDSDASSEDESSSEDENEAQSKRKKKKAEKTELEKLNEQYLKLTQLREKCVAAELELERKLQRKRQQEMELKQQQENATKSVSGKLKERAIVVGSEDRYNIGETYGKENQIEWDAKMEKLVFPVLFFYPEYNQSDFIKRFGENEHFVDHLKNMFAPYADAPSWDKEKKYLVHRLCVYYETKDRLVHVNVHKSLKDIVERKDYVIPVLPVFFVLTKDSDFCTNFVKRKSEALLARV